VQTDVDDERRRIVEEVEITLVNRGDEARAVTVIERLPRSDWWRLTWWTADVEKDDTRSVRFQVVVPPRGETRLRYRVIYRW
jgi:hypothetical protein